MEYNRIKAVVLAAGRGRRLDSEGAGIPKVLREAMGRPLLSYVLGELGFLPEENIIIVVGFMAEQVRETFPGCGYALQERQLGTGHAVLCAREALYGFEGDILVCCGDMPLMRRESYEALIAGHRSQKNACTILCGSAGNPTGYGRIVRGPDGGFKAIVEEKDCTEEETRITELNSGVYMFEKAALFDALLDVGNTNSQGEYYLTDAPALIHARGGRVGLCSVPLGSQLLGVNTVEQLKAVEAELRPERFRALYE